MHMIKKMAYITISGHISNMSHVISHYLSRYEIQLEQGQNPHLKPFTTQNPYTQTLEKARFLGEKSGACPIIHMPLSQAEAVNIVEEAYQAYQQANQVLEDMEALLSTLNGCIHDLSHFVALDFAMEDFHGLTFTHSTFGKLPLTHYLQYEKFLSADEKVIFHVAKKDSEYVWAVYFTPQKHQEYMASVFASLKFQPITITAPEGCGDITGTPQALLAHWQNKAHMLAAEIATLTQSHLEEIVDSPKRLAIACRKVQSMYQAFDVKKYASLTPQGTIFTFSGWMPEGEANMLAAEMNGDQLTVLSLADPDDLPTPAPTLLANPPIVRQFEFFTNLYGLPTHGEIDPTPFLAITYTILFGLMFGDVGHGLALAFLGALIWQKYKTPLGGILATAGTSATVFGFLYGSIFGFEDAIPALWRRPAQDIPSTLMFAAGLGVGLVALSIVLSMYNAFKQRKISDLLFGANGVAGLVFYASAVLMGLRIFFFGLPITGFVVALGLLPLGFIALKHPLQRVLAGEPILPRAGIGQFIFNMVVELFETLLTYITNTISFVRVGAFAISHAGMMHVVLQLSQNASGGRNWLIFLLGNVLVIVIEGLLVGIQVLRLDFYEMFSRFYTGNGRQFVPHKLER